MTAARLLVVEDDPTLRTALAVALEHSGYEVHAEPDGGRFDRAVAEFHPDLAILDVRLPAGDDDGFRLARRLRTRTDVPVLFMTAADSLEDRLRGFDAGADDYLVKPFALAELLARVRAILRRAGRLSSPTHEVCDLLVDETNRAARRAGAELALTKTEFELLAVLARDAGTVFSKSQLLSQVWGFEGYAPNLVEVHISSLRRKLEHHGPRLVHTERAAGYVLRPPVVA